MALVLKNTAEKRRKRNEHWRKNLLKTTQIVGLVLKRIEKLSNSIVKHKARETEKDKRFPPKKLKAFFTGVGDPENKIFRSAYNLNPVVVLKDIKKSGKSALPFDTPPCTPRSKKSLKSRSMSPPSVASISVTSTTTTPPIRSPTSIRSATTTHRTGSPTSIKSASISPGTGSPSSVQSTSSTCTHSPNPSTITICDSSPAISPSQLSVCTSISSSPSPISSLTYSPPFSARPPPSPSQSSSLCPTESSSSCPTLPASHLPSSSPSSSPSPTFSPCPPSSPSYSQSPTSRPSTFNIPCLSSGSSISSSTSHFSRPFRNLRYRSSLLKRSRLTRTVCSSHDCRSSHSSASVHTSPPAPDPSSSVDASSDSSSTPFPDPEREPELEPEVSTSDAEPEVPTSDASFSCIPHPGPAPPSKRVKRKRTNWDWDPSVEYEIEEIVGYHRDRRQKMWYLVKWKNWPSEHNTFEPIENLTGCHHELMRYFEVVLPTTEEIQLKGAQVTQALKARDIYKRLKVGNYKPADLDKFSNDCLDLKPMFRTKDLDELENHMTKEYEYILRCLIGMYAHQDKGLMRRAQDYKLFLKLIKIRRRQLNKNALMEKLINAREQTEVTIENMEDLDPFPEINYISDMQAGEGVVVSDEAVLGCECPGGCNPRSNCCGKISYSTFAYGSNDRLRVTDRIAIYECNSSCRCPPTCNNRVVQRGRQVKLCVFKTKLCGWGVKAMEKIPKGKFVCQYIGELIPDSVAVVRDLDYYAHDKSGYLFDLDFFEDPNLEMYCIDATNQGNLARFINHSCDPNLVVYPVWINCLAPNIHRLAFFAKRNINKGEEIHFDYENLQDNPHDGRASHWSTKMATNLRCHCKADNCRKWVFGNK